MNLKIYVAGDDALIPIAKQMWDAFETSFALPFVYEGPAEFKPDGGTAVSEIAQMTASYSSDFTSFVGGNSVTRTESNPAP